MKTAGWILIVIGALAFIGAASKGDSVFGPLFWIGLGIVLLYLKREREENNKEKTIAETTTSKKMQTLKVEEKNEKKSEVIDVEQNSPVTFEQKEAAICLIVFFAGYNEDIMTNDAAYMISYQSAIFFGIGNYKETQIGTVQFFRGCPPCDNYPNIVHKRYIKKGTSATPCTCALKPLIFEFRDSAEAFECLSLK